MSPSKPTDPCSKKAAFLNEVERIQGAREIRRVYLGLLIVCFIAFLVAIFVPSPLGIEIPILAKLILGAINAILAETLRRIAKNLYPVKDGDPWYVRLVDAFRKKH